MNFTRVDLVIWLRVFDGLSEKQLLLIPSTYFYASCLYTIAVSVIAIVTSSKTPKRILILTEIRISLETVSQVYSLLLI